MRTDGLRVLVLSVVGVGAAVLGGVNLLGSPMHGDLAVTVVLGGGGAVLVWLASSGRMVGLAGWLTTLIISLVAFVLRLLTAQTESPLVSAAMSAIFWWFAAVLVVMPVRQVLHAIQQARRVADNAPGGRGSARR